MGETSLEMYLGDNRGPMGTVQLFSGQNLLVPGSPADCMSEFTLNRTYRGSFSRFRVTFAFLGLSVQINPKRPGHHFSISCTVQVHVTRAGD